MAPKVTCGVIRSTTEQTPTCGIFLRVWTAGELFYSSGEVAVKPQQSLTSHASQAPRLGVVEGDRQGKGPQLPYEPLGSQEEHGMQDDEYGNADFERHLKGARASLSDVQRKMGDLSRNKAQTQFDLEDVHVRHSTAHMRVGLHGQLLFSV